MQNKNILIIDDDPAMIKLFELVAKKEGFNVIAAADGAEGLKKFYKQEFVLVITDLKMPVMDGIEFIKQARKSPKFMNFPFAIVTGNFKEFSAEVALLKNLTIMEKPIKQEDLKALLHNSLLDYSKDEKSTVPIDEVQSFVVEKFQNISSLILEIITKSKPEIKLLKEVPPDSFFQGYYYVSYLLNFGNHKIGVILNYDLGLAKSITEALLKGSEPNPALIFECLKKVGLSMMKKVPENSPYSEHFNTPIPLLLFGSGEGKIIFGSLQNNFLANIYAKNEKGTLGIHLLKL